MFTSEKNRLFITKTIYYKGREIGKDLNFDKLINLVNLLQKKYIQTRITDTTELNTDDLNNKFINYCLALFNWNTINKEVVLAGNRTQAYINLYAGDIPSINIWEHEESINIPIQYEKRSIIWRAPHAVRNYDRSNEGLSRQSQSLESHRYDNTYEPLNII
jgi:hypothetical protein